MKTSEKHTKNPPTPAAIRDKQEKEKIVEKKQKSK